MMKKYSPIVAVFFLALAILSSCTSVKVNGDEEAVLIMKPYFFGHGGVNELPVASGQTWAAVTTDYMIFKITPQKFEETFNNMMTADNYPIGFDIVFTLQVEQGKTPLLYKNFGAEWYKQNLEAQFRSYVRDRASGYKMFQLTSNRLILDSLQQELTTKCEAYMKQLNLPVKLVAVSIGGVTPPAEVLEENRRTAAQTQSKLTQDARANAELARKQAEINKADADKAYKIEMGMSTDEYLRLRGLELEKEKIELVREKQNVTIVMGQGLQPVIPIK